MKSMQNLLTLLLILLLSSWSNPQSNPIKVSGTVTDRTDGSPLPGVSVSLKGNSQGTLTDYQGKFEIEVLSENDILRFSYVGFVQQEVKVGKKREFHIQLEEDIKSLQEVVVTGRQVRKQKTMTGAISLAEDADISFSGAAYEMSYPAQHNTDEYATIHENIFLEAEKSPLSTFSIDVDNASYSQLRRYINHGQQPPKDAVRIEEMLNYFTYEYQQPEEDAPFSVNTELSDCPWNSDHRLLHIGLQGKKIPTENLPPSNLVFLLDVSGSMSSADRLPLVKSAFKLLVNELRPQDRVSIVVYAGATGVVLPSTPGNQKSSIMDALEKLEAGGSTAGGAGIRKAYQIAEENFMPEGNNRVILATDGDFNVGISSTAAMERLIEEKRESGVFLTVLGFGMGNYKDNRMETLADKGNGNYGYIDNIMEAQKVFVNEFGGTLFTIAKDVKLQLEFNPAKVKGYRLIGYENRTLRNEDFNNDRKDAGELGSGHTVTALYEIIPAGVSGSAYIQPVDSLKYQQERKNMAPAAYSDELLTLKLRYKSPQGSKSRLIEHTVVDQAVPLAESTDNFRFSAAVASFGMLLRDSEFKGNADYARVLQMAAGAQGTDEEGYRAEFVKMVRSVSLIAQK